MKMTSFIRTALAGLVAVSSALAANDVGPYYAVFKEQRYNQSDNSAPVLGNTPFRFATRVSQATGGTLTGGTVTPPNTGSVITAQPFGPADDGTGSMGVEQKYTSLNALNAAFGDGQYSLHITGGSGTYNANLTVSGENYPSEVPQLSNTDFSNGSLRIDPRKPFTFTWNSFADHGANDVIVFTLSDSNNQSVLLQILPATATSQLIPANTLQPLSTYQAEIFFVRVTNLNSASISGSTGYGGYSLNTRLNIFTPVEGLANISTRARVGLDSDVLIAGFIVTGFDSHKVIVRAAGPSLTNYGVTGALANPTLDLYDANGAVLGSNDDWQATEIGGVITMDQSTDIENSGIAPADPAESALIATLPVGSYTAIVRGKNNTTGVAVVEVYQIGN